MAEFIRWLKEALDTIAKPEEKVILPFIVATRDGNTFNKPEDCGDFRRITVTVRVRSVEGVNPKLDISLMFRDPATLEWVEQDRFPTISETGIYSITWNVVATYYGFKWTISGLNPKFVFSIGMVKLRR